MRYHVSSSIRGMLDWHTLYTAQMMGGFLDGDGKPYTSTIKFRDDLVALIAEGHELIPSVGCDNFDPKTGCGGHESKSEVAA